MSDSFLPFQSPTTTDHRIDTEAIIIGGQTVDRERVQVCGRLGSQIAEVNNAPPSLGSQALLTRIMGLYSESGTPLFNPTNNALEVEILNDLAGSLTVTDVGQIAGGQANIAAVIPMPYSFDGTNWQRVTRLNPGIVHNNHQTNVTINGYNVSTSSSTALAANASRKGLLLSNISDTRIFVSFGTAPSATPGAEIGIPVEANGGQVGFSSLIDTRVLLCIHNGVGTKRLLMAEW